MDKLYTLASTENLPTPKKVTLDVILQFAASYKTLRTKNGRVDYVAN